jgi:hypothetical protein
LPIFIFITILEIVCVIHAVKTGRTYPWVMVIVFLPLVGCIAYLIMELVPDLTTTRQAHTVKRGLKNMADPNRDFRERMREVELVGSADAKRRLAEEYMGRAMYTDAVELYRSTLTGIHKDDPVLLFGLARALLASGDGAGAQASLDALQSANPGYVSNEAHMVYARALEAQGQYKEALQEYKALTRTFPGEEARCRYALLPRTTGATDEARTVFQEVVKMLDGAPKHYRREQKGWGEIAKQNLATI